MTRLPPSRANRVALAADHPYELLYQPLRQSGRAFAFPCDAGGQVQLDELSERVRNDYFYARAMVGRELAAPAVQPAG